MSRETQKRAKRVIKQLTPKVTPIGTHMILPNTSGDHVRSIKRAAPVDEKDLVNKKYVDSYTLDDAYDAGSTINVDGTDLLVDVSNRKTFRLVLSSDPGDAGDLLIEDELGNNLFKISPGAIKVGAVPLIESIDWVPITDNAYDFGHPDYRWKDGYFSGVIYQGTAGSETFKIETDGSVVCQGLNASTNKITNVVDPTADQEAATKKYVDDASTAPGGNDTEIQFNDSGSFGASANLVWDGDLKNKAGAKHYFYNSDNSKNTYIYEGSGTGQDLWFVNSDNYGKHYFYCGGTSTSNAALLISNKYSLGTRVTSGEFSVADNVNQNRILDIRAGANDILLRVRNTVEVPFYIEGPRSMEFTIDSDNDDTGQSFKWSHNGTKGAGTDLMVLDDSGHLDVKGAISSATTTITASSDAVDVAGVNTVFINPGAAVVIGGFANGVTGQRVDVVVIDTDQNVTMEHEEAEGTQKLRMHQSLDETLASEFGGWSFVFDGIYWYDISHARHV